MTLDVCLRDAFA
ncbi:hypothetical protein JKP11_20275 [Vibrio vulnificus]|nr:hypothetical protein [Vibrio cholerae]MCA3957996.1 hypothetical protein [Vibrio vulnificus]EGR1452041.1 hypothetical protein [Vibrio cholerae]EHY8704929.1 hypothetical protein [Vibrio cholerae]EJL6950393.1 hypothetical protein [Vibrio cholerae]EKF9631925.1 hypothetical protein [Vibrio cholerae]